MVSAHGQILHLQTLSPNASRMDELRDVVLSEWETRLRSSVVEAEALPHPILMNTFPLIYQHIVKAITPEYRSSQTSESNTLASEHGGERARLTNYNAQALIQEYQQLRWAIFDVLKDNEVLLGVDECNIVNSWIDRAIRESVTSFALAEAALRERFTAALTHDLRNPLAVAHSAAQLITRVEANKLSELASKITASLNRMDAMIKELLDAAVLHVGGRLKLHIEHADMFQLATEVCDQFRVTYDSRIRLRGMSIMGYFDRNAMKRAIENLLQNAAKYGEPGGCITFSTNVAHERLILAVHNFGEPIPPGEIECIFQVFQRAEAACEGTKQGWGVGLAYVRNVAESHGGSITADSSSVRGTTFVIDIPLDARPFQNAPTLE